MSEQLGYTNKAFSFTGQAVAYMQDERKGRAVCERGHPQQMKSRQSVQVWDCSLAYV